MLVTGNKGKSLSSRDGVTDIGWWQAIVTVLRV